MADVRESDDRRYPPMRSVDDLSPEERKAILTLDRLAKSWPKTLRLFSWSGSLRIEDLSGTRAQREALAMDGYIRTIDDAYIDPRLLNEGGDPDEAPDE